MKKKSFFLLIACGIFAACLFSGCEKEVKVSGIIVEPKSLFLSKGDVAQLSYMVTPYGAENKSIKWTSQDATVATVSQTGLVTAIGEGETKITATTNDGHFTDVVAVTVANGWPARDSIALVNLHKIAENLPPWDFTKPMDQWQGVVLNFDRRVISINAIGSDMIYINNPLNASIGNLTCLKKLALGRSDYAENALTIPPEIGMLTGLQGLYFYYGFTGIIPPELGNLIQLEYLGIFQNSLTGGIPKEIGNLTNLKYLFLSENQMTGSTIPPELGNLYKLETLRLEYNQLTGSIPKELGNLTNLEMLFLFNNQLTGSIPPELENLSKLEILNLDYNQLTGSIPPELGNINNSYYLGVSYNSLSGTIPQSLLDRLDGWSFCPQNGTNFDNFDCNSW